MTSRVYNWLWWAYLFDMFDITLGGINILPEFAGYFLLIGVLNDMKQEEPNIAILYPFVFALLITDFVEIASNVLGSPAGLFPPFSIIMIVMRLYLWYVMLTTAAQMCDRHEIEVGKKLYTLRNWSVALQLCMYLMISYLLQNTVLLWVIVIIQLILIIWFRMITVDIENTMYQNKSAVSMQDICTDETAHLEIIKNE